MLKVLKQVKSAATLLNPEEAAERASRRLNVLLVAGGETAYAAMEDFLAPASAPHNLRMAALSMIYRYGDQDAPKEFDLVLYDEGFAAPDGAFVLSRTRPETTLKQIVARRDGLALPLARHFPPFRKPVTSSIVQSVSRENALFAIATSLPNVVPCIFELPWAMGEFASDTVFLTLNQMRMAFLIAAACGHEVGFANQRLEMLSIAGGAFGWRALARELVGKVPFGGGLIPKGAIAYAGTYVIGKGLARLHCTGRRHSRAEQRALYQEAYRQGREVAQSALQKRP